MTLYREQLANYCNRSGYTRSGVAKAAGYNKNYVSNVIKGDITPTIEALEALANALNVPLTFLLVGEEADTLTTEIVTKFQLIDPAGKKGG